MEGKILSLNVAFVCKSDLLTPSEEAESMKTSGEKTKIMMTAQLAEPKRSNLKGRFFGIRRDFNIW